MSAKESRPRNLASARVLVIHEDRAVRAAVVAIVRRAGAREVRGLGSHEEAVTQIRNGAADLVLAAKGAGKAHRMMGRLAGMHGPACPAPVILMASEPTRATIERALAAGFSSVIATPFSMTTLDIHVQHAFARERSFPELADRFELD